MGQIESTIAVYERLKSRIYKVIIEDEYEIVFSFKEEYYHHLAGYHYLTDIVGVAEPQDGTKRFYRRMKRGEIKTELISGSSHFASIRDRIENFDVIEQIVSPGDGKVIVDFDKSKADSKINAKYFLYKRVGDSLLGQQITYYALFLGYNSSRSEYYPATYVVEPSNKYTRNQIILDCKIEHLELTTKTKDEKEFASGQS